MGRRIGFVGTGLMGSGMVRRLLSRGHAVRIYNRTRSKAEAAARSGIFEMKGPPILRGDFTAFFPLRLMDKDLRLALEAAHALRVPVPALAAVKEVFSACLAAGQAEEDFSSVIKFFERFTGAEVRSSGGA